MLENARDIDFDDNEVVVQEHANQPKPKYVSFVPKPLLEQSDNDMDGQDIDVRKLKLHYEEIPLVPADEPAQAVPAQAVPV